MILQHNLDEKCGAGLNRTLMRKSTENPGLLECNIDSYVTLHKSSWLRKEMLFLWFGWVRSHTDL